jgi:PAS domain S-box-containing protein
MFRPSSSRTVWPALPLSLVLSALGLLALVLGAGILIGARYAAHVLGGGIVFGSLFLLPALGMLAFTAHRSYVAVTRRFERSKTLMRSILASIPTGVLTTDSHATLTSFNRAAERLLLLPSSAAVGSAVDTLAAAAPELVAWIHSRLAGDRRTQEAELSFVRDGDQRVTLRVWASDLEDERGQPVGLVVILRDVTELNRLELQLRRADKLGALGTLAAGVAHEVKNPLHALSLNLHLLTQELTGPGRPDAEIASYLDILRAEIQRIHRIVENFLRFARPPVPETKPVDLNGTIERVLSLVAFEAAGREVRIHTQLDPDLDSIPADEGQLCQVFLNVVINALQATPPGGALTVRTRVDGPCVETLFRDTGDGIRPEHLPHLFDPYFTTRPGGVGLGLAIAHRIVEGHHGTIDVDSGPGSGTAVVIRLPRAGPVPGAPEDS